MIDENIESRGSQEPNLIFPLGAVVPYTQIQCAKVLYRT